MNPNARLEEFAAQPLDADDAELLRRTARVWDAVDPVPSGLIDRVRFEITLDALQAEVAELQRGDELAGVRGAATDVRTVTFTSPTLTTMITLTEAGTDRVRIDGWIAPGADVEVELRAADRPALRARADVDGRFVFPDVAGGLVRFVLRRPGEDERPAVITPAIEI